MISIVIACSKERLPMLERTLPLLLTQDHPNYEIVIVTDGTVATDPKIRTIMAQGAFSLPKWMNMGIKASRGYIVLLTMADMRFQSPFQILRMAHALKPRSFVTEKWWHENGERDNGIYCQCLMAHKSDLSTIGYFDERYDGLPGEDGEMVSSLLEQGLDLVRLSSPQAYGVLHIDHPRTDWSLPENIARIKKSRDLFYGKLDRTPKSVGAMYAKILKIKGPN